MQHIFCLSYQITVRFNILFCQIFHAEILKRQFLLRQRRTRIIFSPLLTTFNFFLAANFIFILMHHRGGSHNAAAESLLFFFWPGLGDLQAVEQGAGVLGRGRTKTQLWSRQRDNFIVHLFQLLPAAQGSVEFFRFVEQRVIDNVHVFLLVEVRARFEFVAPFYFATEVGRGRP